MIRSNEEAISLFRNVNDMKRTESRSWFSESNTVGHLG